MATRDEKKLRQQRLARGRNGGRPSLLEKPNPTPRAETSFDRDNISLRCLKCDTIWNGPHTGEVVKPHTARYRQIDAEDHLFSGNTIGGISDAICNKRSCIDAATDDHVAWMQQQEPDRDLRDYGDSFRKSLYAETAGDADRFPGGFIDDVPASEASDE